MPGVPDFYQGTEFWDTSLVDPDNRRPVDFHSRQSVIANPRPDWTQLVESWQDGRLKMAWTRRLLDIRNSAAMVFSDGSYDPIAVSGPDDRHVIAFARRFKTDAVIVAVGRRMAKLTDEGRIWPRAAFNAALDVSGYTLEPSIGGVENGRLPVERIFTHFPACILKAKVRRRGVFGTEAAP